MGPVQPEQRADTLAGIQGFGVSPTDITSTFIDLKARGAMVASLGSRPAGDTMTAGFCLSTDVGDAAYKATIDAMGGRALRCT
jgi:ribose transport system substrate-binding protein